MSNGDDAMTSAEFAKLMGAYPEPAGNPLPTYGGFMDNSAANFSWVQNNDYFGAESKNTGSDTLAKVKKYTKSIMEQNPTLLEERGKYGLFEHPTQGDLYPIMFYTPAHGGIIFNSGWGDTDEFSIEYCRRLEKEALKAIKNGTFYTDDDWSDKAYGAESFNAESNTHCKNTYCELPYDPEIFGIDYQKPDSEFGYCACEMCDGCGDLLSTDLLSPDEYAMGEVCVKCKDGKNAEGRPQGMTSTKFRNKETGEIATRIPISEMRKWEKMNAESDGWFSVSFPSNEKQANTEKKGFEDGDVGGYRYKIMENSDKQGWTVLAQLKNAESFNAEGESLLDLMLKKHQKEMTEQANCKCIDEDSCYGCGACYGCERGVGLMPINGKCGCGWTGKNHPQNKKQHEGDMWGAESFNDKNEELMRCNNCKTEKPLRGFGKAVIKYELSPREMCMDCQMDKKGYADEMMHEYRDNLDDRWYKYNQAESFNAEGRQEQYGSWGSKASAKRQMKKVGLEGWAIKQKGNQWALFRPSKNAESFNGESKDYELAYNRLKAALHQDYKMRDVEDNCNCEYRLQMDELKEGEVCEYCQVMDVFNEYQAETINGIPAEEYYAEMDLINDGMVAITNTNDETVGVIEAIDDEDDDEMVEISIQNENLEEIGAFTLDDGMVLDDEDNYLAEMKKPSLLALALGVGAVLLGGSLLKDKLVKNADTDIIESPDTGDLSPADYEELVVESTGYAVDIIPMSLDGSFMGSRFSALPTERYVEYNDPGIGAHIDVALNRDEDFLEPEMAMVQAAEGETDIKEAQAPGQSPYLSMDGQEPKDFSYRVLKETHPVSLDPAVVPFIPQSMSGYTGNDNRPPSVYNKMFNLGVLGQTPLFVPGNHDDIGASHTGSRRATPSKMGSIGGPLSDAVNGAYTDGQTSKSLAQWSIENSVQQTSDTEALVIDRSSGNTKRIRRV